MQVGRRFEKDRNQGEIHRQMARFTLERTADQRDQEWFIERTGAEALNFRIAQQENWEQAEAVRDGRQPRIDPDGIELQEIAEGLRTYRSHEVGGTMDSRPAILTQRLVKRLANGLWESEVEVVNYRYARRPFSGR
jgi:hypothetical protein